jgi:hypothetical protein
MIDADLAALYGVQTKALNQAVTRNRRRFRSDFMFRLTKEERRELVTNCDRFEKLKHSSTLPRAFTEQGVAMLSSVLNSDRAIKVNISIMRAFTRLRQMLSTHEELKGKIEAMERKYDRQFGVVFEAIKQLIDNKDKSKRKIGFEVKAAAAAYSKRGKGKTQGRQLDGIHAMNK